MWTINILLLHFERCEKFQEGQMFIGSVEGGDVIVGGAKIFDLNKGF